MAAVAPAGGAVTLRAAVVRQFARPHGILGHAAGLIMATRLSNRERNRWTVDLLPIRPTDTILEIGCGPGLAIAAAAGHAGQGLVVGLDHSAAMIGQAGRRNRGAIAAGRVRLVEGGVETASGLGLAFDIVFSVNVVQFLPDRAAAFRLIRDLLRPGGTVATTYMPRHAGATPEDARRMADSLAATMEAAGFTGIRIETLPLEPVPAVAVLGRRPG